MKIAAIICEYNPFHNGHQYQIEQFKKEHPDAKILALMSGDFTQRGAPAIVDKYARCKMALCTGVDTVIELPSIWATSSAFDFANGAIHLLNSIGGITDLIFGCEDWHPDLFQEIAGILAQEPPAYKSSLKSHLAKGLSFPAARQQALNEILKEDVSSYINEPNNLLALEYLRALSQTHSSIRPYAVIRKGSAHTDNTLSSTLASASALRKEFRKQAPDLKLLRDALPEHSFRILTNYKERNLLMSEQDFSPQVSYALTCSDSISLRKTDGIDSDLADRILNLRSTYINWDGFCELLKTKNYTYTRISRILTHLLLKQTDELVSLAKDCSYSPYIRILGCKKSETMIIKNLKASATIPVIDKLSAAPKQLSKCGSKVLNHDIFVSEIYRNAQRIKSKEDILNEYQRGIVLI